MELRGGEGDDEAEVGEQLGRRRRKGSQATPAAAHTLSTLAPLTPTWLIHQLSILKLL